MDFAPAHGTWLLSSKKPPGSSYLRTSRLMIPSVLHFLMVSYGCHLSIIQVLTAEMLPFREAFSNLLMYSRSLHNSILFNLM